MALIMGIISSAIASVVSNTSVHTTIYGFLLPWPNHSHLLLLFLCAFFVFLFIFFVLTIDYSFSPRYLPGRLFLAAAILCFLPVSAYEDDGSGDPYQTPAVVNIVCCNLMTWCMYIGYATTFTPLLCKIYRIKLITDQPLRRGLKVLPRHVAGPYILAMVITVGSLIVWTVLDPYKYEFFFDPLAQENLGTCSVVMFVHTWQLSTYTWIFMCIFEFLISVMLVTLVVLAYQIRHINPELGDSQRICRLVIFIMVTKISWFISIMIIRSIKSIEGSTRYVIVNFLFVLILFNDSVGIISFIVLPRMYFVWYQQKHGHLPEHVHMFGTGTIRINDSGNNNINNNDNNNNNNPSTWLRTTGIILKYTYMHAYVTTSAQWREIHWFVFVSSFLIARVILYCIT